MQLNEDVIRRVLRASRNGKSLDRITHDANLSYSQVKQCLDYLSDKNFIDYDRGRRRYRPNDRGLAYLRSLESMSRDSSVTNSTRTEDSTKWHL